MDNRIVSVDIVDGELIVTYQDGSTESLGPVAELDPEELSAAVLKNAGDIVDLKRAVSALQTSVTALDTAVGAAETSIDSLEAEVGAIKNDLNQFPNGTYPNMTVGNADQLISTVGIEDNTPYLFRTSGGSNDIGDREDVKKIVGGTIVNNQLVDFDNISLGNTVTRTDNNAFSVKYTAPNAQSRNVLGSANITSGHKFLFAYDVTRVNQTVNCSFNVYMPTLGQYYNAAFGNTSKSVIHQINDSIVQLWQNNVVQDAEYDIDFTYQITDLTLALGTSIADYVYSLETATAGAGVAWLKKHFPKQFDSGYQAYDAGSLQSVSGLTMHKMVGFNQWDEELELGGINENTGSDWSTNDRIRSKNFIPVLPNTVYYLKAPTSIGTLAFYDADKNFISALTSISANYIRTTPSNAWYMKFNMPSGYGTTYNHDICINLHWDGEKDGTYEPYKTWSYALDDSVVIRGIPKVDASGNLYYDGDEYLPDGTINRRYGIVDLGSLVWGKSGTALFYATSLQSVIKKGSVAGGYDHIKCVKYVAQNVGESSNLNNKCMSVDISGNIQLIDSDFASETSLDFKNAMNGVMLIYELATSTTETAEPYQSTQIVDDFGTEEFVLADGAFPVPVGHDTWYQNNLRAKLEMSPDSPDGDGLYVVQQESGENTYVPLASTATIQDILTRLTALENA